MILEAIDEMIPPIDETKWAEKIDDSAATFGRRVYNFTWINHL